MCHPVVEQREDMCADISLSEEARRSHGYRKRFPSRSALRHEGLLFAGHFLVPSEHGGEILLQRLMLAIQP